MLCVVVFAAGMRKRGRLLFLSLAAALSLNALLKALFRVPRLWVAHPETAPLLAEGGFAFPCIHTQIAAAVLGALFLTSRRRSVRFLCAFGILAVGASRLLGGLQSPADILTGIVAGILCEAVLCRFFYFGTRPTLSRAAVAAVLLLCAAASWFCRDAWGPGLSLSFLFLGIAEKLFRKADDSRTAFGRFYGTVLTAGLCACLLIFLPTLAEWLLDLRMADIAAVFLSTALPCMLQVFPLF